MTAPDDVISNPSIFDEKITALYDLKKPQVTPKGFYPCNHCLNAGCSKLDHMSDIVLQVRELK